MLIWGHLWVFYFSCSALILSQLFDLFDCHFQRSPPSQAALRQVPISVLRVFAFSVSLLRRFVARLRVGKSDGRSAGEYSAVQFTHLAERNRGRCDSWKAAYMSPEQAKSV